ncbi:MAG TPA: hypothetical protein VF011_15000 [Terriglobales bacterium]
MIELVAMNCGGAHAGADYAFVITTLAAIFWKQGVVPTPDSFAKKLPVPVRPVALIFGRPACKVFKEELLPDRNWYHLRSGTNIEIFYMGYADPDAEHVTAESFDENDFSEQSFESAVSDFEEKTTWKYSGETDIILLNSFFTPQGEVRLDFTNVFALSLETAIDSKLIRSGRAFIEEVIRQSRHCSVEDVVTRTSDVLFLRNARSSFLSWVMGLVKLKADDLGNAYRSCVRDISRRGKLAAS